MKRIYCLMRPRPIRFRPIMAGQHKQHSDALHYIKGQISIVVCAHNSFRITRPLIVQNTSAKGFFASLLLFYKIGIERKAFLNYKSLTIF